MNGSNLSVTDKLFGSTALSPARAALVRQTYLLLSLSVFSCMAGGYIGATTPAIVAFTTSTVGWIVCLVALNVVPGIAIAARHNPVLGVTALVGDGFIAGIAISPLLFIASRIAPDSIFAAVALTAIVFLCVTAYVMTSKRTFSAPRGLMWGIFGGILGVMLLNGFLHLGALSLVISLATGVLGVLILVYSTSTMLNDQNLDSPIPSALALFAGLFNIFVAVLSIFLRSGRRS